MQILTLLASVVLSCTAPVSNTDGSAVRAPLTFKFYQGAAVSPAQTSCAYTWPNLSAGTYTFTATAIDSAGAESAKSASATTVVSATPPQAPAITLNTLAGPVFSAQVTRNSLVWPQVGTVVAGKPCDPTQAVSFQGVTYWRVDVANVTALPGIDLSQSAAFSQCQ